MSDSEAKFGSVPGSHGQRNCGNSLQSWHGAGLEPKALPSGAVPGSHPYRGTGFGNRFWELVRRLSGLARPRPEPEVHSSGAESGQLERSVAALPNRFHALAAGLNLDLVHPCSGREQRDLEARLCALPSRFQHLAAAANVELSPANRARERGVSRGYLASFPRFFQHLAARANISTRSGDGFPIPSHQLLLAATDGADREVGPRLGQLEEGSTLPPAPKGRMCGADRGRAS